MAAQTSRGTVTGLVTDSTGAVVPGASVELTNRSTNVVRNTQTNSAGIYRFDAVDLAQHDVTVKATGFTTSTHRDIPVQAGQVATLDIRLEVGETQTVVEVTADATAVLQTEAPVRGANLTSSAISNLPVASRNPANLALTLPGVASNRYGFGNSTFSVNGSRGRSNNFLIDGTENNDISVAGQGFQISNPDAVAEVAVQTSNFDAEYGRAGGAVVNVVTKSGTNDFHGSVHYFLDSTYDDAITNTQSLSPAIRQRGRPLPGTEQYYGGTFGGPIKKNKTFFFGMFQDQRQSSQNTNNLTTLSQAGRDQVRGMFPQGANPRADLYLDYTKEAPATSQFFTQAMGNGRAPVEFGTAIVPYANKYLERQWMLRGDHTFSERDIISMRYLSSDTDYPAGGASNFFPGFQTSYAGRAHYAGIAHTHVFSPVLTNELRLVYNRLEVGYPLDTTNPLGATLPYYNIASITAIGVQTNLPQGRYSNNYGLQNTMSYIRGNHTFRFGVDILNQRALQLAPIRERGEIAYAASGEYSGFANFLDDFGGSSGSVARDFGTPAYYPSFYRQAYFFQDRWRATKDLTLTLGLRYEYFGLPMNSLYKPAYSGIFNLDPVTYDGPYSKPNQVNPDKNNFGPTVGLAWSPTGGGDGFLSKLVGQKKTVLRTGYQIGYDSFFNNIASNAAVATPNVIATSTPSQVSTASPRGVASWSAQLPTAARAVSALDSQTLILQNLRNPYYQRWSFGIQREAFGVISDVSYVGSQGIRLFANEDFNPLVPVSMRIVPAGTPASRQQARLDSIQGSRLIRTNGGSSNYHALQVDVTKRFRGGSIFKGAYTWSKTIDNASEVFGVGSTNLPQNTALPSIFGGLGIDRSLSFFDRTHRAVFSYVYELPFYREQHGAVGRLLGGWQVQGITTFETGVPLNVYNGQDADGIGGNYDRPIFNPNGTPGVRARPLASSPTGYVNPDATGGPAPIDPATAMYIGIVPQTGNNRLPTGNLGRNTTRVPGVNTWNVSMQKRITLVERLSVELRGEFFNLWNHPQYGSPSISPFSPGQQGVSANVYTSPNGRFLQPQFADGGGRVIRYQIRLYF